MTNLKRVAMIPARLNSKRVPRKNLRLINGRPLISYVIQAAVDSNAFDRVFVNSEADIFEEIAREYGAEFYKRPESLSADTTVNDEFAFNFIQNIKSDYLIQILPTSPLLSSKEINEFVDMLLMKDFETVVSVVPHQIACIYKNKGINFSPMEAHISSQEMTPVYSYATVLMGWKTEAFESRMARHGFAYHGGEDRIGYFPITGLSQIDVDTEDDFKLAEVALFARDAGECKEPKYYAEGDSKTHSEVDVPEILKRDGISEVNFDEENLPVVNIPQVIKNTPSSSWCRRMVNTESNSATLISQMPGEGNRMHYHPDWNEWWYIVQGKWNWILKDKVLVVSQGDLVFIPKGVVHRIEAIGEEPAIRLAVSRADVEHIYPSKN